MANATADSISFSAQDSRIEMKLQALDSHGNWKDIEYTPNSWCGNSYHTIILEPNKYWEFTIPKYEGSIKSKIRAILAYGKGKTKKEIYSNSIDASVNPAQFFNKNPYNPNGIMDPYNE